MKKRVLSVVLALVMALSLAPAVAFANGDGTGDNAGSVSSDKTIMLGTNGINAYDNSTKKVDTVYYGVYTDGEKSYNVPWYVIGLDASNGTGFMFSKYILGFSQFRKDFGYYGTDFLGAVSDSALKTKTESLYNDIFSTEEKENITPTDITCSVSEPSSATYKVTGAYLFPLSNTEASGLDSNILSATNIIDPSGSARWWWFRSSNNDIVATGANDVGTIYMNHIYNSGGVRPAFNLNMNSVLFTSLISTTDTGSEYKLTLLDDNMTIAKTEGADITKCGSLLTIPYTITGSDSANATQVSVLVLDEEYTVGNTNNANVLAYGKLNMESFAAAGSGTFTLPDTLAGKTLGSDYHVYILAEDVNGTYETDYAGTPVEISEITEIAEAPTASVENDTYTENQSVELSSATEGASIYYTTDGTDPSFNEDGTPAGTTLAYKNAISVTGTQGTSVSTTIKAVAVKSGMVNSSISEFTYIITLPHEHGFDDSSWQSDDTKHWRECSNANCDKSEGYIEEAEHADTLIKDHKCDTCGKVISTCTDADNDGKCDICGKAVAAVKPAAANTTTTTTTTAAATASQTGDSSHVILWIGLAVICAGAITAVTVSYKRRQSRR